jgi:Tfp pilus assembly protein PilO
MDDPVTVDRIGWVALVGLVTGFLLLIWFQGVRPLNAATQRAATYERAVEVLSGAEGRMTQLSQEVTAVAEAIASSEALLPRELNLDDFLAHIGRLADHAGVRVETLRPGQVRNRELFRELRIELRVIGEFLDVYAFLATLERTDQLARVERLQIVGNPDTPCAADARLVLYYAPPAEAVTRG